MNFDRIRRYRYQLLLSVVLLVFSAIYFSSITTEYIVSTGDNYTYEIFAQTVFSEHPFKVNLKFDFYDEHPIYHHQRSFPPLYPIFLAVMHLLFGQSMFVNLYATCVLGLLCALPTYYLGRQLWSPKLGVLAAAIALISPTLRSTSVLGMSEPLLTLFSLWALYCLLLFRENNRRLWLVVAGIFCGLGYLARPTGLALAGAGLLYLLTEGGRDFHRRSLGERLLDLLVFTGIFLLVSSPWLIRNYRIFGDPFYYVGRFFAGQEPGTLYATLDQRTLGELFSQTSLRELASRYGMALLARLKMIYQETGVLSLLILYGFFAGYYKRKHLLLFSYLALGILITLLNPGQQIRHLVNLFPVVTVLGLISLASFYQFQRYHSLEDYLHDNFWRKSFVLLFLVGLLMLAYESYQHERQQDPYNELYPAMGKWLREHSDPNTVIMSDPTSPVYYYAQRPLLMFPREVSRKQLAQTIVKYNVEYVLVLFEEQWQSIPRGFSLAKEFVRPIAGTELVASILKRNRRKRQPPAASP